jgi:transaldolase
MEMDGCDRMETLVDAKQSPWLDDSGQDLFIGGSDSRLATMARTQHLKGLVSSEPHNLRIAIAEGACHREIGKFAVAGLSPVEIYVHLLAQEARRACDLLAPVYRVTNAIDGYACFDCPIEPTDDADQIVVATERFAIAIGRENAIINVPATPAGIQAMEKLTSHGINVNATLIFGVTQYRDVVSAYISGMEQFIRAGRGYPETIASLASINMEPVDTLVDRRLAVLLAHDKRHQPLELLLGRAAISNAGLIYKEFGWLFSCERWKAVAEKGARVQRPLWLQTGSDEPKYSKTRYVNALIAAGTVIAMEPETWQAFRLHGQVRATLNERGLEEVYSVLRALNAAQIDLDGVACSLLKDGLERLAFNFDQTLTAIEQVKRTAVA